MARRYRAADFDYPYPPELVAQHPLPDRTASRLLVLDRETGAVTHRRFRELPTLLDAGDLLVLNTSRVIPARLIGRRENGREAEVLFIHSEPDGSWLAMVHPGGKLKAGRRIFFGDDAVAEIVEVRRGGVRRLRLDGLDVRGLMARSGRVPLPPYIHRAPEPDDRERYQTVYAREEGSVAAPTAGLHFTDEILESVRARGVTIAHTVLHVGPGTFKPVDVEDPARHTMHAEWYELPADTADAVGRAKAGGRRVWAVGTTVARTLETAGALTVGPTDRLTARSGWTDLFVYPPYDFRVVDALLTNFHLPRSTLLMLVAAFAGYAHTMAAYREAVRERYRLFSYGDAMAIL